MKEEEPFIRNVRGSDGKMQNKLAEIKYQTEYIKKRGCYKLLECPDKEYMRLLAESGILNEGRHMILDLGCGTGAFGLRLARLGFPVVGIDISILSIKVAARLAKKRNVNADFIVADVEKMPFRDRAFRLVFCGFVLHHMPNILTHIMQETNRILALGGKLFLCEPNAFNLGCFIAYHFGRNLTDLTANERALNPKELVGFLALSGFVSINFKDISDVEHIWRDSVSSLSEMAHRVIDMALRVVNNLLFMPGGVIVIEATKGDG